ncbi:MAG: hypothetical protein HMLKMBBP_00391 [Planctomycetes bacterium]|nr:hypothetical protein [Planctomycetota bacterium]
MFRAVLLNGPRQSGKTTLARMLAEETGGTYLTLDDAATLASIREDPRRAVDHPGTVVIDEVQRGGDALLLAIKQAVDEDPRTGRFVLTGSTRFLQVPNLSESLAGRIGIVELRTLSAGEIAGRRESFLERLSGPADALRCVEPERLDRRAVFDRVCAGGFPGVYRAAAEDRAAWFDAYLTTVIQRDVRDISDVQRATDLARVVRLIAARTGSPVNVSDVARDAGIPRSTAAAYSQLLQWVFLTETLPAWSTNLSSKITKHPKAYAADSGLAAWLLGASVESLAAPVAPALGPAIETFAVLEILKQRTWSRAFVDAGHLRDRDGWEVDLVLETADRRVAAVEVKATSSPGPRDVAGLARLRDRLGDRFVNGVLLHLGDRVLPFGDRLTLMPISSLWAA